MISEKPMVIDEQQCRAVLEAEQQSGRKLTVGFNYRYAPKHQLIKETLMSGAIEFDNLVQTAPFNPGVIGPGAGVTSAAVPLAGAALGDAVVVSYDRDLQGAQLTAYVEGPDVVRARLQRSIQAGAVPARVPAGTLRFRLLKKD